MPYLVHEDWTPTIHGCEGRGPTGAKVAQSVRRTRSKSNRLFKEWSDLGDPSQGMFLYLRLGWCEIFSRTGLLEYWRPLLGRCQHIGCQRVMHRPIAVHVADRRERWAIVVSGAVLEAKGKGIQGLLTLLTIVTRSY